MGFQISDLKLQAVVTIKTIFIASYEGDGRVRTPKNLSFSNLSLVLSEPISSGSIYAIFRA